MRTCEKSILRAIMEGKSRTVQNTAVSVYGDSYAVYLHGNAIARGHVGHAPEQFTLAGWNTVTTRSRLNALGVYVTCRQFIPYYNGKPIDSRKWYDTGVTR